MIMKIPKGKLIKTGTHHSHTRKLFEKPIDQKKLKLLLKGSGIYGLYKGKKDNLRPYYIGLASEKRTIYRRLHDHLTDDLGNHWKYFRVWRIKRKDRYIKDLETLLLRVYKPKRNRQKGKISNIKKIDRELDHLEKEALR